MQRSGVRSPRGPPSYEWPVPFGQARGKLGISITSRGRSPRLYTLRYDACGAAPSHESVGGSSSGPTAREVCDKIALAANFAKSAFLRDTAVMIGELPTPVCQGLLAEGAAVNDPLLIGTTAFLAPGFPVLDEFNQERWQIFPLPR